MGCGRVHCSVLECSTHHGCQPAPAPDGVFARQILCSTDVFCSKLASPPCRNSLLQVPPAGLSRQPAVLQHSRGEASLRSLSWAAVPAALPVPGWIAAQVARALQAACAAQHNAQEPQHAGILSRASTPPALLTRTPDATPSPLQLGSRCIGGKLAVTAVTDSQLVAPTAGQGRQQQYEVVLDVVACSAFSSAVTFDLAVGAPSA